MHGRPPVVTILGHVDHGKTSLLDKIRKADVAAHEAGGITQHVGAYRVTIEGNDGEEKTVVFLDTPGHEAFTTMRARGAQITDLVVLVVAADDGVMPQTIESINHAKAAGVPIIVALNKIDKPEATDENIHRIYGQLAEHGLNPTDWGGDTEIIRTSAETDTGITDIMEVLDYQAELLELKADYGGRARGTVIEAEMQPGRGAVARVLVQQGHLKVGDFINIGRAYGRVREMSDDRGRSLWKAGPATPLEVSGIDEVPDAGDKMYATDTLKRAEEIATQFREAERQKQLASQTKVTLDNFAETLKAGQVNLLRVVLKADVQGSMETLRKQLEELGNEEVAVRVLHAAVGGITESDVLLADASDAIVIGFQVSLPAAVRDIADERRVDVRQYRIIYELLDDVKKALEGMLTPETNEQELGRAEVKEVFRISKVGNIAGCLVASGSVRKDAKVRVLRDGVVVTDNRNIESLRRVKDEVREVRAGTECGIRIEGFDDIKAGDEIIYAYRDPGRSPEPSTDPNAPAVQGCLPIPEPRIPEPTPRPWSSASSNSSSPSTTPPPQGQAPRGQEPQGSPAPPPPGVRRRGGSTRRRPDRHPRRDPRFQRCPSRPVHPRSPARNAAPRKRLRARRPQAGDPHGEVRSGQWPVASGRKQNPSRCHH